VKYFEDIYFLKKLKDVLKLSYFKIVDFKYSAHWVTKKKTCENCKMVEDFSVFY